MFAEIRKEYLRADVPCPLPVVICNIGETPAQPRVERPEGFQFHHVLWVERGEGLFTLASQQRVLSAGEGLFCRRGVPHGYERTGEQFSTRWLTFLGGESALAYYSAPEAFFFRCSAELSAATLQLEQRCRESSTPLSRSAAGFAWLSQWLASVFEAQPPASARIQQYLEAHFSSALTLEEIGAHVGMDRFTLCRYFRESTGTTVMEQLKRIRIAKAKQYLRYTTFSMEEIGALCGYGSPSYFGKIFREETGRTPRAYREQHGGGIGAQSTPPV